MKNREKQIKTQLLLVIIGIFLFLLLPKNVFAEDEQAGTEETITVAVPQAFNENEENQNGYTSEYLSKLSQFMRCRFEFVLCEGATADESILMAMDKVASGEADMMGMMLKSDALTETYEYPENGYGTVYTILSALENNGELNETSFYEMDNLRIAVLENAALRNAELEEFCQKEGINYTTVLCQSMDEQYQAMLNGEADLMLRVSLGYCNGTKEVVQFAPRPFYFAVTKGNEELTIQLNEAIKSLNEIFPFYQSDLYDSFFSDRSSGFLPTQEQQRYLLEQKELKVLCIPDGAPYVFVNDEGALCGISVSVMNGFARATGIKVNYEIYDKSQDFGEFYKNGNYDCVIGIPVNDSYNSRLGIITSEPYTHVELVTFSKNAALRKEMKDCTVALLRGSELDKELDCKEILYFNSTSECVAAVADGKVDVGYGLRSCVEYATYDLFANLTILPTLGKTHEIGFSLSQKTDKKLIILMNQYINALDTETLYSYFAEADGENEKNEIELFAREHPASAVLILTGILGLLIVGTISLVTSRVNTRRNNELQKALAVKSDFLSRMSHDLRTPLNAIIGMSNLGRTSKSLEESIEYHDTVYSSGKYLLGLINDTLDMSKMDNQKMLLNPQPYQIKTVVKSIERVVAQRIESKHIHFVCEVQGEEDRVVLVDSLRLEQVFVNLLSNAIKFTPEEGTVYFSVKGEKQSADTVHFTFIVRDNGIGMTREFQERMYEAFEQENVLNIIAEPGTGLGLAIVKRMVDLMEGQIVCHSEVGIGTEFIVDIQVKASGDATAVEEPIEDMGRFVELLEGKRILVAEDHLLNQKLVIKLLENKKMLVDCTQNGKECLEQYQQQPEGYYDAILMDIRMPVMNGLESAKAIRSQKKGDAASIPIIAMTANAFAKDREASFQARMNAHLAKPVEPELLYQTLVKYCVKNRDES